MLRAFRWILLLCACTAMAQQAATPSFHHVLGLEGAKRGAKGTLSVSGGALVFTPSSGKAITIPTAEIEDISQGNDSKRTFSGIGQVTMLGPYGSGRFFSLFRDKLDVLTVSYRDENGGLHGAIFSMTPGQSAPLKTALLAAGAKSSTPVEEAKSANTKGGGTASEHAQPAAKKEAK